MIQAGEGKGLTWAKTKGMERQERVRTIVGRLPIVSCKMVGERKMSKSYYKSNILFSNFPSWRQKKTEKQKEKEGVGFWKER